MVSKNEKPSINIPKPKLKPKPKPKPKPKKIFNRRGKICYLEKSKERCL